MLTALAVFLSLSFASSPVSEIKVDQVGYLTAAPKIAFVVSNSATGEFIVRRPDGSSAFQGKLSDASADANSGDSVRTADFSPLRKSGSYYLEVPGVGRSWEFTIGPNTFRRAYYLAMRSFYGQRCGTAVDLGPEFPGFTHEICHRDSAFHPSSGRSGPRAAAGGWHDAGDYGRYVVNSGIATGTLLWAWELYSKNLRRISLNIPESPGKVPDILDEIRWNLDWMLTMQDDDGGVFHKQTSERFSGFVMPEKDTLVSYVIGTGAEPHKSTCATADLAAVAAIAARTYKPFDSAYADRALAAARKAFQWAEKNPNVLFRNPPGVSTGAYGDRSCADELLWASAELYRTTREAAFQNYFTEHYRDHLASAGTNSSWPMVAPFAFWTYALSDAKDSAVIRDAVLSGASEVLARSKENGYRIAMTSKDYVWGSNAVAANYGVLLLVAAAISHDQRYADAAFDHLHYLLGRNALSLSYVTQLGANAVKHPHHRPTGARGGDPWPGLLSGGPNRNRQDPAMKRLPDLPPARMFLDEQASFATNEIAINWNAPLVFLLAGALTEAK